METKKTCKTCVNNENVGRSGCLVLTKRIKNDCWAWMDKPMKEKALKDIIKYREEGGGLNANSYNRRSRMGNCC